MKNLQASTISYVKYSKVCGEEIYMKPRCLHAIRFSPKLRNKKIVPHKTSKKMHRCKARLASGGKKKERRRLIIVEGR